MSNSTGSAAPAQPSFPPGFLAEYSGYSLVGTAIAFLILDIFFVALRFLARRLAKTPFGWYDMLIIASLIFATTINVLGIVEVSSAGVGYHTPRVLAADPYKIVVWAKLIISEVLLYIIGVALPKLAMLCLYLNIFTSRFSRITCYVVGGIVVAEVIIVCFVCGFSCVPLSYFWDKTIPGGYCIDQHKFFAWASFPNVVTDIVMLLLPLPTVWKLQISRPLKVGLTFTFLTGSIGLGASIARFVAFFQRDPVGDPMWVSVELMIWTITEVSVYLIAACLPTLRPLVTLIWGKASRTLGGKSERSYQNMGSGADKQNGSMASQLGKNRQINKTVIVSVGRSDSQPDNEEYHELVKQHKLGFTESQL